MKTVNHVNHLHLYPRVSLFFRGLNLKPAAEQQVLKSLLIHFGLRQCDYFLSPRIRRS